MTRKYLEYLCTLVLVFAFLLLPAFTLFAQSREIAAFTVNAGAYDRTNTPVSTSLKGIPLGLQTGYELQLYEIKKNKEYPVASQLYANGYDKTLRWILEGQTPAGTSRHYILKRISASSPADTVDAVHFVDDGKSLTLMIDDQKVLSYRYAPKAPPEGVSDLYTRSGYIHPLWSPKGEVITRIQPSDHYHHYGIWNPWTHTEFEGREVDFWNLGDGEGTVRHQSLPVTIEGDVFGGFEATLKHVDLTAPTPSGEKVALNEKWNVTVWNVDPQNDIWLIDFVSTLSPASESPLIIKAYRYQGFSLRATEKWNDETATLLTSRGYNKSNANGTRAQWVDINGISSFGHSGILFMTHPGNHNFPEHLRIWPTGANNGKGNVYFNFNPAQQQNWTLKPGNSYTLRYRMMVYDGKIDSATAKSYWQDFGNPPKVIVEYAEYEILEDKRVLVYTKNGEGYVHENIPNSIEMIQELGETYNFTVDTSEDPADFTQKNLQKYDALIFSNTNNEIFKTEAQEQALQNYIRNGGGFVGIHSASGSERDWPWFWDLIGGTFYRHAPFQEFTVEVTDHSHPSTAHLSKTWVREDECYYLKYLNPDMNVLLHADMTTVEDDEKDQYPGKVFGDTFPLAWYHEFEGGRSWYTALGHSPEDYDDPKFIQHVLGGLVWVTSSDSTNH